MDSAKFVLNPKYGSIQELIAFFGEENLRVDLGCGYVKPKGFIGIDNLSGESNQIINADNAPDILMNLDDEAIPFGDSSCVEVRASHFLEHSKIEHIINEAHRILKPGGIFLFAVPYANSAEGMYPGHHIFLTEKWFHENINFRNKFEILKEEYFPTADYLKLPALLRKIIPFHFARTFLFNACWQMVFVCKVKK